MSDINSKTWGVFIDYDSGMVIAALHGEIEIVRLCKEYGATDYDEAMVMAALNGHVNIVKLCKEYGATDCNGAVYYAANNGHIEILKLCKTWGVFIDYDSAMEIAALNGHVEIMKLCKEYGVQCDTEYRAMFNAAEKGHVEIVKLCREWLGYEVIHNELYQYHHKLKFSRRIADELVPIAWHPDRWEDEKKNIEKKYSRDSWKLYY